ncbi:hypothetical protein QBC33DRAFT_198467 [Phialemonium atrogriseum]|uniref:MOSC domain-containing protein n=1 Tax=Phialemonium atrogriseum TaxID=1093897 RepID=A0AAJ0BYH5_9PEZI|nr:uncharacterized protein QBC33DRAFT_198467 [Phialemonium atrogriseum]KAK1764421.1 hypothetical protein QBC33DRAFT_198467 [Phialemonium atrogriseum]
MKVTQLYVYPIKALRGISLSTARLGPLGIKYDRHFMLFREQPDGQLKKLQLSSHPQCALFEQRIASDPATGEPLVIVRYHAPPEPLAPPHPAQEAELSVPLEPEVAALKQIQINLHGSPASAAYRVGPAYDAWFGACLGFDVVLVYIGDGRRRVLGSSLPPPPPSPQQQQKGWLSTLASYAVGTTTTTTTGPPPALLTFSDVAPFLVTAESSLGSVRARLSAGDGAGGGLEMYKFRPNVVVEGEGEWAEDFWAELTVVGSGSGWEGARLLLTGNCARCTSLNVDYRTGRTADGELGTVLKKLMRDRRVDPGVKWSPIFGRYAFLDGQDEIEIEVGDEVEVTGRRSERSVWDWPGLS